MGFFATYVYDGNEWTAGDLGSAPGDDLVPPYLLINIFDSDIAEFRYSPSGSASGVAFVGFTPRSYFFDENASAPTDTPLEAAGLAHWADHVTGNAGHDAAAIQPLLATDGWPSLDTNAEHHVFVEQKTAQLLELLGIPNPDA